MGRQSNLHGSPWVPLVTILLRDIYNFYLARGFGLGCMMSCKIFRTTTGCYSLRGAPLQIRFYRGRTTCPLNLETCSTGFLEDVLQQRMGSVVTWVGGTSRTCTNAAKHLAVHGPLHNLKTIKKSVFTCPARRIALI